MRLTVYSDYALRVLMYLAVHSEPMPTIGEIAASYGVSRNHLMKVVYELGVAGYVETVRGKKGGLRLGRRPEAIGLGEIIRHTEPDLDLVPCFARSGANCCAITPACSLKGALHRARAAFMEVLDSYTLADLVRNGPELRALLSRGAAAQELEVL
jgi:Rrf2 family nitric oxide-sensitive transcriptional repressor